MSIYLIVSNSYKIIKSEISKILKNKTNIETIYFDLNKNSILEIIAEAGYNSLFNEEKNIIVYNSNIFTPSDKLNEKESEILLKYFENPNPLVNLIFVCRENIDSRKKIVKLLKDSSNVFNYSKISYKDLMCFIKNYIKEINYNLDDEVINYLIKTNNQNYDIICNEIDKLQLCFDKTVNLDVAKNLLSTSINDNVFKLVDEVVAKNQFRAAQLLNDLKILKIDATTVIALITREYRLMLHAKIALSEKLNLRDILIKDGLVDWQINKVIENIKCYSLNELKRIICLIGEYDYKLKSGKIDRMLVLDLLIMEIIN